MRAPKDWQDRFEAEPSDVERWSQARVKSVARNRSWFLFGTGLFFVVFGLLLVDAYLVAKSPTWQSILGLDVLTAPRMLQMSAVIAVASLVFHVLIRVLWKRRES
jgi:hypothetical protein